MAMKQEKFRLDYLPPKFYISDVTLEFLLDPVKTKVTSLLKIKRNGTHQDPLVLNGEKLDLVSVKLNDHDVKYDVDDLNLTVFDVPDEFTLQIVNFINPQANTEFEGLYISDGAFCTQCEAEGFRKITYYLDRPDVSAKFTTRIVADKAKYPHLLSNGNCIESGDLPNGQHYVIRQDPFSKPSYLFALVAGDFDVVNDQFKTCSGRDVTLQLFVDRGNYQRGLHAMASIKRAMEWDEKRFGFEYDLDLFQVVAVDFFNMGAMENKGLNIFNSKYVLADDQTATDSDYYAIESVIGHEYFHNWTGDRVTCRDWFQLSLKEGLTVFRDQEFSSDLHNRTVERFNEARVMRTVQFMQDLGPMAHPIRPNHVLEQNNFYSVTVYEKGAEVIRMIHTILGEEKFQQGMKLYISRFDGGCATCEDFVQAMEDASGIDLKQFRHWYEYDGTPVVDVEESFDQASSSFTIKLKQRHESTQYLDRSSYPVMTIPLKIEVLSGEGKPMAINDPEHTVGTDGLFLFDSADATFTLSDVSSKPSVSYLGDFSAPIKLNLQYEIADLTNIILHSENDFNRYDAMQNFYQKYFDQVMHQLPEQQLVTDSLLEIFKTLLDKSSMDGLYLSALLSIPSYQEVAGMFSTVEVEKIHESKQNLRKLLAHEFYSQWQRIFESNRDTDEYVWDQEHSGRRAMYGLAFAYLCCELGEDFSATVLDEYDLATNMTTTLAILRSAVEQELLVGQDLLDHFAEKWNGNGLIMDNYFRIQASVPSENTLDVVRRLMSNSNFTMSNPNRIRSLIGTFVAGNLYGFHSRMDDSYGFLTEILKDLNTRNPQTAARLIEPLMQYKRYDQERSVLMKNRLEELSKLDNLSSDLYEMITKSLSV